MAIDAIVGSNPYCRPNLSLTHQNAKTGLRKMMVSSQCIWRRNAEHRAGSQLPHKKPCRQIAASLLGLSVEIVIDIQGGVRRQPSRSADHRLKPL